MSQRTIIKRHPERDAAVEEREILAAGVVAHLGFCQGEQPFVIPMIYQFDPAVPNRLYLHGSHASRALKHLAGGAPVCVTVTMVDGLVYSRDAQNHSANYRSVVCFGRARPIKSSEEKATLFEAMIGRYHPGRTAGRDYAPPTEEELRATAVVEVHIEEMSAKVRRGGPNGPRDDDPDAPGTSGVV